MSARLYRTCIIFAFVAITGCGREEIAFPSNPPEPAFVSAQAAIARLAGKVAAIKNAGAVDCGEIGKVHPVDVARCATSALRQHHTFFTVVRQSSGLLDYTIQPNRDVITSVISGDENNVEMLSIDSLAGLGGGGCGVTPLPRVATPPRVHVSVIPLMVAGRPTPAARTNILLTNAVIDRKLQPADSRAPYDVRRQKLFTSIELDEWGRVVRCDDAGSLSPLNREPVCGAVLQWRYKPASFLGRRISTTREVILEIDGRAIRTLRP